MSSYSHKYGANPRWYGMPETLKCRYTGETITQGGPFVLSDDADIDWDSNRCPSCGASGQYGCTDTGLKHSISPYVHASRQNDGDLLE